MYYFALLEEKVFLFIQLIFADSKMNIQTMASYPVKTGFL
jgi:hypothetical protein